jgi:hypothetical protein
MSTHDTLPMKEVSHTPPDGDSVTNVWQRGHATDRSDGYAAADD